MPRDDSTRRPRFRTHLSRWWWAWYLALVGLSHLTIAAVQGPAPASLGDAESLAELPVTTRSGVRRGESMRLAYRQWHRPPDPRGTGPGPNRWPVVLLHGSPGDADSFSSVGPLLAERGHRVIAPDLPGYGSGSHWLPDYSPRAQARAVLLLLDELGIERAHIVGWSIGGAIALNMIDLEPARAGSLTLLASIAAQQTEGSGSYAFEHAKYAVGYAGLVLLPEAVPHFGLLGPRWMRHTFIRNFLDMDQRPLRAAMERTETPTLILHGRDDFLVGAWAAEHHHDIMPNSHLVMLDASHFLPFLQANETATRLATHFHAAEHGGFVPGETILAPAPVRAGLGAVIQRAAEWLRWRSWFVQAGVVALLGLALPTSIAFALAGWLLAGVYVDVGVALLGMAGAQAIRRARSTRVHRRPILGWLWLPVGVGLTLLLARFLSAPTAHAWFDRVGAPGLGAGLLASAGGIRVARSVWTLEGRARLLASLRRLRRHEFWPMWARYAPLMPWLARLALRHRGVMIWTRVNPGIPNGGGVVEESKDEILRALAPAGDAVLPHAPIEPDRDARARLDAVRAAIASRPDLGGYPIILKPDVAEQGRGLALVRDEGQLGAYLAKHPARLLAQRYHPGPHECGIFWMRDPAGPDERGRAGHVFSITRKTLPTVRGDGRRTIRELILTHPRHRCLADVFLRRMRAQLDQRPPPGEEIAIGHAGNHAQGAIFRDASDLITPELEARIDEIARSFHGLGGRELDFGRFDIRYADDRELRAGRGLAIVELNGTLSESTTIYDPDSSFRWAQRVLRAQWSRLFELGAYRRALGDTGLSARGLVRLLIVHHAPGRQAASVRSVSMNKGGISSTSISMPSSLSTSSSARVHGSNEKETRRFPWASRR